MNSNIILLQSTFNDIKVNFFQAVKMSVESFKNPCSKCRWQWKSKPELLMASPNNIIYKSTSIPDPILIKRLGLRRRMKF